MITIIPSSEIEQGSQAWLDLRAKFVSATDAYSLLRGKSIEEILNHKTNNSFKGNYYTERGHRLEPEAKEIYSAIYQPITDVGFVINNKYEMLGCSPDGLVGEDGMIEVKCFNEKRHLEVYQNLDPAIFAQVQYQLWVTERAWNDLTLYNPDIDDPHKAFLVKRILPDKNTFNRFEEIFSNIDFSQIINYNKIKE